VDILPTAIGIVVGVVLLFILWNDMWRPRKRIDVRNQEEPDRARHGWFSQDHVGSGIGGHLGGGGDSGGGSNEC
jgi:hypothetical protein